MDDGLLIQAVAAASGYFPDEHIAGRRFSRFRPRG
jgi:hypothetical protein